MLKKPFSFFSQILTKSMLACIAIGSLPLSANTTRGLPSREEAWHDWAYSLSLQAATWGGPLVTMYALRHHNTFGPNAKAAPNTIWRMEGISTPELAKEAGYVTPNVNTIYGFGFLDLRQEPIILDVPDSNNLYYMVEVVDMWTNAFAYVGGKSTGYKGGKFAIVGPDWKGDLPSDIKRIDSPTPWVLIQPRVHVYRDGKLDNDGARNVLKNIKVMGLSAFQGKTPKETPKYDYLAPDPIDPDLPVSVMNYKDPLQFWEILSAAMNENPPPRDQIEALLPMFKPLGLEIGKQWSRSNVAPPILEAMKTAAEKIGNILDRVPIGTLFHGAFLPPPTIGNSQTDYFTRATVARVGLTANTPYEAIYWMYPADEDSNPLSGQNKYTMQFEREIPFYEPGFWSITMYDATNNYTVPNPIHRYMLGSDTPEIKKNNDGSFTLYIQNEYPGKDKESNWLPAPSGPFYLIARSYAPKPEVINLLSDPKSWPVPIVQQIKAND